MIAQSRVLFDNSPLCFNLFCVSPCAIRNIIRQGYDIEGTCIGDICVTCLCPFCSACQLYHQAAKHNTETAIAKQISVKSQSNTTEMANLIKSSQNESQQKNITSQES